MSREFRFPLGALRHLSIQARSTRRQDTPISRERTGPTHTIPYPRLSLEELARDRISMGTARFLLAVLWLSGPRGSSVDHFSTDPLSRSSIFCVIG